MSSEKALRFLAKHGMAPDGIDPRVKRKKWLRRWNWVLPERADPCP